MNQHIIEISHLNKSFGSVKAVSDLSFHVRPGELFAFLGVNGAGKSTTISIMCGQLKADSGSVKISGLDADKDIAEITRRLGVVFQGSVLDKPLSVRDNLESRAALYGITGKAFEDRLRELSELLDFSDLLGRSVGKLSGGQRRRIDIARALLHRPEILILDEPTTGLDPQTRKLLWSVVRSLREKENMTVFLTTQGQMSAVGTLVSAGYGFICGAYMPISNFSEGLQKVLSFLPGTYATSLLHNHWMRGAISKMGDVGVPEQVLDAIRDGVDCNIYFFGEAVSQGAMYLILVGSVVLVTAAYVLINVLCRPRYGDR